MSYSVLFLDIDGTILKPDHQYTDSTKEAIKQANQQGIEVFIATGRPLIEVMDLAEELGVNSFIGYNGSYAIYDEKVVIDEPIDPAEVEQFLKIAKDNNQELILYTNEKNYFTNQDDPFVKKFAEMFQLRKNATYTDDVKDKIISITALSVKPEDAEKYEITSRYRVSQVNVEGATTAYDLIRTDVNKGEAIRQILEKLEIPKDEAIAFGDGLNDLEMLQNVGEGFAMGNADDYLKANAKHVTTSVTDSGIYEGLKKLGIVE